MSDSTEVAPWIQTFSGGAFDLLDPKPEQIKLVDIAVALSRIARFNGHTSGDATGYSVAQHSLLVESLMPDEADPALRLHALLHDAPEAYIGDLASPFRIAMRRVLRQEEKRLNGYVSSITVRICDPMYEIERRIAIAVAQAFALPILSDEQVAQIKTADLEALAHEKNSFMAAEPRAWGTLPEPRVGIAPAYSAVMDAAEARNTFIDRFRELVDARHGL